MYKRVMVAVCGRAFLILVLGWRRVGHDGPGGTECAVGAWDCCTPSRRGGKSLLPLTVLVAALVPVCVYLELAVETAERPLCPGCPDGAFGALFVLALFFLAIRRYDAHRAIPFSAVTDAIFAGLVFPLMLSCLLRAADGAGYRDAAGVFPLCISFGSDTFPSLRHALWKAQAGARVSPKKDRGRRHRRPGGRRAWHGADDGCGVLYSPDAFWDFGLWRYLACLAV